MRLTTLTTLRRGRVLALALAASPLTDVWAQAPEPTALDAASKAAFLEALRAGRAAYDEGRLADALAAYDRAAALASAAEVQLRRAACLERLERPAEAAAALQAYLALAPDARDRGRVEADVTRLETLAAAALTARVELTSRPAAAEVRLGGPAGRLLGQTPISTTLPLGEHVLYVRADGHQPESPRVQVRRSEAVKVDLTLVPVAPPTAALSGPAVEPAPDPTLAYALLGTGAALAIGAGVLGWYTAARIDEANGFARDDADHTRGDLDDLQAPIPGLKTGFYVTAAAALLAVGTGGGLLLFQGGPAVGGRF